MSSTDPPRGRYTGGFQTVDPNIFGWIALLLPAAAVGYLIAWAAGLPPVAGAVVGAVLIWRIALYLDFRKQQNMDITYTFDASNLGQLDQMTAHLRSQGIIADGREVDGPNGPEFHLTVKHKDKAAVEDEIGWA